MRAAVHELLVREGYAGTTIDRVAAHAGVGRGALYRRWRSKAEMVFAVVVHPDQLPGPADTGTLAGDLVALAKRIAELTGTDHARAALAGLAAEVSGDPELGRTLEAGLFAAERRYVALILARARARGELGLGVDAELVRRLLVGAIAFAPLYAPTAPPCPGYAPTASPGPEGFARVVAAGLLATHPPEVPT